jgi:hypothetical protein
MIPGVTALWVGVAGLGGVMARYALSTRTAF